MICWGLWAQHRAARTPPAPARAPASASRERDSRRLPRLVSWQWTTRTDACERRFLYHLIHLIFTLTARAPRTQCRRGGGWARTHTQKGLICYRRATQHRQVRRCFCLFLSLSSTVAPPFVHARLRLGVRRGVVRLCCVSPPHRPPLLSPLVPRHCCAACPKSVVLTQHMLNALCRCFAHMSRTMEQMEQLIGHALSRVDDVEKLHDRHEVETKSLMLEWKAEARAATQIIEALQTQVVQLTSRVSTLQDALHATCRASAKRTVASRSSRQTSGAGRGVRECATRAFSRIGRSG